MLIVYLRKYGWCRETVYIETKERSDNDTFFLLRESDNDILAEQNLNIKGLIVIMEC